MLLLLCYIMKNLMYSGILCGFMIFREMTGYLYIIVLTVFITESSGFKNRSFGFKNGNSGLRNRLSGRDSAMCEILNVSLRSNSLSDIFSDRLLILRIICNRKRPSLFVSGRWPLPFLAYA